MYSTTCRSEYVRCFRAVALFICWLYVISAFIYTTFSITLAHIINAQLWKKFSLSMQC